jgi:tRNA pseudouridine55 synthase
LNGLVIVDKPRAMTSAAVVNRVRARLGVERAGHTGTLDPLATGVLPVCLGEATKLAGHLIADDKAYRATIVLGVETDTYDADGMIVRTDEAAAHAVDRDAIAAALAHRTGAQLQTPPMFSAIKVGGRRLHELARAGHDVARVPRSISITRLDLIDFAPPRVVIDVECSKGTYVRSLAADLGHDLGCGAHLVELRRTRCGAFAVDRAIALERLDPPTALAGMIPLAQITGLPNHVVDAITARRVLNAVRMPAAILQIPATDDELQLVAEDGRLLAVAAIEDGTLIYRRVFK